MVILAQSNIFETNMCDDAKSEARLNVLYSPFRKRELNPQDWESKMTFWKNSIRTWCVDSNNLVFTLSKLQAVFVRNGRPATCLMTVVSDMLRRNEVIRAHDLLNKSAANQSWTSWAVNYFVKTPVVWSFTKLKETVIPSEEISLNDEFVYLEVLQNQAAALKKSFQSRNMKAIISLEEFKSILNLRDELSTKVILHWLQLEGQVAVTTVNDKMLVKLSTSNERVKPFSEADVGLYKLQQNEQALIQMLEQLEKEKQDADQEARNYLKKGMRQVAKTCLRKKKELEKCIDKRASALENVQVLLSRVKEAESDGEILESYRMGLSALKATFKNAGLSDDSVGQTMDQVHEVLEVHEEIQNELSKPVGDSLDEDLENELAELLSEHATLSDVNSEGNKPKLILPDLPEPPCHSPSSLSRDTIKVRQNILRDM